MVVLVAAGVIDDVGIVVEVEVVPFVAATAGAAAAYPTLGVRGGRRTMQARNARRAASAHGIGSRQSKTEIWEMKTSVMKTRTLPLTC